MKLVRLALSCREVAEGREVVVRREKELEALIHRHHADQEKLINTTKQVSLALVVLWL